MLVALSLKESTIALSVCVLIVTIPRFSTYNWRDTQIFIWLVENITTPCSCSLEIFIQKKQTDIGAKISILGWDSGVHFIGPPPFGSFCNVLGMFAQKGVGISPVKELGMILLAKYSLTLVLLVSLFLYLHEYVCDINGGELDWNTWFSKQKICYPCFLFVFWSTR